VLRVSYSSISDWLRCPRYFAYKHVERRERIGGGTSRPLAFGKAGHKGQEALWSWAGDHDDPARLQAALNGFRAEAALQDLSWEDQLLGEVLLIGYAARWDDLRLSFDRPPAAEVRLTVPVLNPAGHPDPELEVVAVLDVIATDVDDSAVPIEHKFTSSDISPGSAYWGRLDLNLQASIQWIVASDSGLQVGHVLWDAVRAPEMKRLQATPSDKREFYKRATKRPDGSIAQVGDPKPGIRLADETNEEFIQRVMDRVLSDPLAFYGRQPLHRSDDELARVRMDIWSAGTNMRRAIENGTFPRNLDACQKFNMPCQYLPVCSGETTIDDPRVYCIRTRPVEEKVVF
jgi:hypothetical protein